MVKDTKNLKDDNKIQGGVFMNYSISVVIKGRIDSRTLYKELLKWEANVTDLIDQTYVFVACGVKMNDAQTIAEICRGYGECDIEIKQLPIV